jgi:hypothetical protein
MKKQYHPKMACKDLMELVAFLRNFLPYKPLDARLMAPMERPKQKKHHCENIEG